MELTVHKIHNNNIVSSLDPLGKEMLLMGRGIGWQSVPGQPIDPSKIEKSFRMDDTVSNERLIQLLLEVDVDVVRVCGDIIEYAHKKLDKRLNKDINISLTDHVNFAIKRKKEGILFQNVLLWDTKRFYPDEFSIGMEALRMIRERLGVDLPEDEACSIALHIVSAEYDCNMQQSTQITKVIQSALAIVRAAYSISLDENSLHYHRFTTHLLFFAKRLVTGNLMGEMEPDELYQVIRQSEPKAFRTAQRVAAFIYQTYDIQVPPEEITFLTVHIARVTRDKDT